MGGTLMVDQNLNERVSYLEAQDKNIFHQLDEIKTDVRDIKRLTVAVERIALQTKSTLVIAVNTDKTKSFFFPVSILTPLHNIFLNGKFSETHAINL